MILLAALVTALLPGAALVFALRLRSPLLSAAVIPTASVGLLLAVATAAAPLGLPFSPAVVGSVVALLLAVGLLRRLRSGGLPERPAYRRPTAPAVVGLLGGLAGAALAARMWLRGFGGLDRIPQEHDMITHLFLVGYIERSGEAAPWLIRPIDVLTREPVRFYPGGGHLTPALLSRLGADPVVAINAVTVVCLAVCWVVSVAVLTAVAARRIGTGPGTAWLAAGTAAVIAPALYRPGVHLMHDGGIYSAAVALALAPGLIAALLLTADRPGVPAAVACGAGAGGLLAVHPSAAATVAVSVATWLAGDLFGRDGWQRIRRAMPVLLGAGIVAGALALPLVLQGGDSAGATGSFPVNRQGLPLGDSIGSATSLVYGGYLDPARAIGPAGLTVLYLYGVLVVVRACGGLGLVAAWASWTAITVSTMFAPAQGPLRMLTGLFYNDQPRIWSHVAMFVPSLAALGVVLTVTGAVRWARRRVRRPLPVPLRPRPVASALVLAAMAVLVAVPVGRAMATNTEAISTRYAHPDFVRVGPDDLAAVRFLAGRVTPGERVLNSANDGSIFLYVDAGIPIVNTTTLGTGAAPYTYQLMRSFRDYPEDPEIRRMLRDLDVGWVYVDSEAPGIGAGGAPEGWVDASTRFTTAPGLTDLDHARLPGLTPAFRSGTVTVYRLDLDAIDPPA
ncbi:DUF6541 family protein [Pseudonocardia sp. NPDC046786]|uniref:DUF6541 family protein n=1 Tax=Pseudonocardia sp. NPDC046786 TaxID=3155471 RepID=UPI0033DCAD74